MLYAGGMGYARMLYARGVV
jgi:hypothetical protein